MPCSTTRSNDAFLQQIVVDRAGREWCLFLDRDGVINRRVVGDYVRNWDQFEWLPNARPALAALGEWARHIIVVTNQQGVGKGLMSIDNVDVIHTRLTAELDIPVPAIESFEVCPHLESNQCGCRKPNPGLALAWLKRHPGVDASLSIMVGDSSSDLEMGRNLAQATGGCTTIHIGQDEFGATADASFDSLWDFAEALSKARREVLR